MSRQLNFRLPGRSPLLLLLLTAIAPTSLYYLYTRRRSLASAATAVADRLKAEEEKISEQGAAATLHDEAETVTAAARGVAQESYSWLRQRWHNLTQAFSTKLPSAVAPPAHRQAGDDFMTRTRRPTDGETEYTASAASQQTWRPEGPEDSSQEPRTSPTSSSHQFLSHFADHVTSEPLFTPQSPTEPLLHPTEYVFHPLLDHATVHAVDKSTHSIKEEKKRSAEDEAYFQAANDAIQAANMARETDASDATDVYESMVHAEDNALSAEELARLSIGEISGSKDSQQRASQSGRNSAISFGQFVSPH